MFNGWLMNYLMMPYKQMLFSTSYVERNIMLDELEMKRSGVLCQDLSERVEESSDRDQDNWCYSSDANCIPQKYESHVISLCQPIQYV